MGGEKSKALLPIGKTSVIQHVLRIFQEHPAIERICVVARKQDFESLNAMLAGRSKGRELAALVEGGAERQDSVWRGIAALQADPPDWVLVHDGARPFCSPALLERVLDGLNKRQAVVPVIPIQDTVRRIDGARSEVVDRSGLFRCQTPQGFHWNTLLDAHQRAKQVGLMATDDAQLVEAAGQDVAFVEGETRNLKITTASDLAAAEWILNNPAWGTSAEGGSA